MSQLTTKNTKFEVRIQNPMKQIWKVKSQRKAQEGHLKEGKTARPTKARKMANQAKW
jgi:hypothetical protein